MCAADRLHRFGLVRGDLDHPLAIKCGPVIRALVPCPFSDDWTVIGSLSLSTLLTLAHRANKLGQETSGDNLTSNTQHTIRTDQI